MILFPKVVVKHSGTVCSAHTNEPIEVNISLPVARTRRSRDNWWQRWDDLKFVDTTLGID